MVVFGFIVTVVRHPLEILLAAAVCIVLLLFVGRVPLTYNIRNLSIRWRTTLLTALAFTLVIGLLIVMVAFVNGMQRLTESSGHPENVVILADGATDEIFSNLSPTDIGDLENQKGIASGGNRPLASREVYMVASQPLPNAAPGRPQRRFLQVRGIDDPRTAAAVHQVELHPGGNWFSEAGVRPVLGPDGKPQGGQTAIEVVLGEGLAREMARDRTPQQRQAARNPDQLEVGDTFSLDEERPWVVAGVMQSSGLTFDSEVWAKRDMIAPLFGKQNYTSLVARTHDAQTARQFKEFLTRDYKKAAVQAQVETDYYASLGETAQQFSWAVAFVTIFIAAGGVFGVMNTMFAAISQRIKDIGVMRLLGFARWQILVSFLMESMMIALIGGLLGCALGMTCDGLSATSVVASGAGGGKSVVLKLVIDTQTLSLGLLLAIGMGVIGGLVPSLHAMRLKPLEALR